MSNEEQPLLFSVNLVKYEQGGDPLTEPFRPTTRIYRWPQLCQQMGRAEWTFQQLKVPRDYFVEAEVEIAPATKWVTLNGKNGRAWRFPLQTILPKVQMPRIVEHKQLPKDVEVNRVRQQYARINLGDCLKDEGLSIGDLYPTQEQYDFLSENAFKHFLPISFFDSNQYDGHSPEAWMKLGTIGDEVYELPAKAFLPRDGSFMEYVWQHAAVSAYNPDRHTWKVTALASEREYEVPPVQIMFLADNPRIFAKRLKAAVEERDKAENLVMMESIVDCVLLLDINKHLFYPNELADILVSNLKVEPELVKELHQEIYLLYEHLNAVFEFDKYVKLMPHEFRAFSGVLIEKARPKNFVSLKSKAACKMVSDLKLNIPAKRNNVMSTTLYYIPAGIQAMGHVAFECQYVESMSVFVTSFTKPLALSDFLNVQEDHNKSVGQYLTIYWPGKVSSGIRIVLRSLGMGWLDIGLHSWNVYPIYKISRFLLQTKFRMQSSIQKVMERSIRSFTDFLASPCKQFLCLDDSYMWRDNFIETDFPYEYSIFELVIGVSDDSVIYSTKPENFEPVLLDIFRKGLERANAIRLIDAETMERLQFAPHLYIMTTELVEDLFVEKREELKLCYTQAVIPLRAYAKLFERFVDFYQLDVNAYMRDYAAAGKTSLEVKFDIQEHKRQKEELRIILPADIVIGPFLVLVNPLKQFLIKKHIEVVRRLFEYYVSRMSALTEDLMEQGNEIHNGIATRPQSIEHLYKIRDYSETVPERVEQLKADIQVMWLEHEMLDNFFYNLRDLHFSLKWQVYAWPHIIMTRLAKLREEQNVDIEYFQMLHSSECILFEERLESLNLEIHAYSFKFDPDKAEEIAVEAKKTWKIMKDLQNTGELLQSRQKLFEMEDLSMEFLEGLVESFAPYRNLWTACSDFQKLEYATIGNPIANVELEEVSRSIANLRAILENSHDIFHEKPEIQNVANVFLKKLDEFVTIFDCIKWLRNENWMLDHWRELNERSGMKFKYTSVLTFEYLMSKGIMGSLDLVEEISKKANSEAEATRLKAEQEKRERERQQELIQRNKLRRKCRRDIL